MNILLIAGFGALGVLSRYFINQTFLRFLSSSFPYDTLVVNILGSFLIGIVYVLGIEKGNVSEPLRVAMTVGFLGGFTTFSAYTLDGVRLLEQSQYLSASLYLFGTPVLGIFATLAGIYAAR